MNTTLAPARGGIRYTQHDVGKVGLGKVGLGMAALLGALATAACNGEALPVQDLGDTSDSLAAEPEPPLNGEIDQGILGRWIGEAEDALRINADGSAPIYQFPSGSTRIALEVFIGEDNLPGGSIVFGEGTVPEPQAGVAYPPGFAASTSESSNALLVSPPLEGFRYKLLESVLRQATSSSRAIALSYWQNQHYADWCALQAPLPLGNGDYSCIGATGITGGDPLCRISKADGTHTLVDCDLAFECSGTSVCNCDAEQCSYDQELRYSLWLQRTGAELVGGFVGGVFDVGDPGRYVPLGRVRFQRVTD